MMFLKHSSCYDASNTINYHFKHKKKCLFTSYEIDTDKVLWNNDICFTGSIKGKNTVMILIHIMQD